MDADRALQVHRVWKDRFRTAMARHEQLNVDEIAADDCCPFGQWLHGEAKACFGHAPAYACCIDAHAAFHREAGKVAQRVNAGQSLEADAMLAYGTPYAHASEALAKSVIALFKETAGG